MFSHFHPWGVSVTISYSRTQWRHIFNTLRSTVDSIQNYTRYVCMDIYELMYTIQFYV